MNKKWLLFTFATLLALFLVSCNGEDLSGTIEEVAEQVGEVADDVAENADEISEAVEEVAEDAQETVEEVMSDEPSESAISPGGAGYVDRALAGEFEGTTVTMLSVFSGEDEIKLNESIAEFEEATGIDFVYEGTSEFEAIVTTRVEGGDAADIIGFPQPGLLANFAREGFVVDLNEYFERSYLEGQYINSWLDMATFEGSEGDIMGGVWHRTNGKSQVWYPKTAWDAAGYPIPTTHAEMLDLMDQIVADGDTPWCIGIESGAATGWTATDWTEEYMLRTTSLDNYDAWVRGDLDFDDPIVKNAIETWSSIWFNDDYVLGGREQIATTFFGDSPTPMFEDPPRCWMHKQGSFITSFFPEGTEPGVDYDFFYLPPVGDEFGRPYLVAGDIYAAFSDRPEVLAFMEYFSRGESLRKWMEAGGAISPHRDVDLAWHGDPIEAAVGEAIANATSVRFDASDLMPGEVGAGTFWTGMTSYINGDADLDTILAEIEASWPEGIMGEDASEIDSGEMGDMLAAGFLDRALAGEFAGETVTMLSVFSGEDEIKLNASIEGFEEATGIDFVYEGTSEFEAIVTTRVEGGDAADIIGFPQPGLLANFAREGFVVDLNEHFSRDYLEQQYINSWLDMATFEGPEGDIMGGVWHRTNGKSQVWYPKAAWDAAGYPIPTTHAEMLELMDTIVADGDTPWCIGIESGAATGWTATDWTEEYMLRTTSLDNYDAWVRGDLDFDDPIVKNAIETWSSIWFNDDYVLGGREQIATTFFGDSPTPMFEDPPRCWMHKQGSFITSFFPEGTEPGVDYDFFYLPPVGDEFGRPYLVAGDIYAAFSDEPAVLAFMEYFSRGESLRQWMEAGGAISPHRDVDLSWHGDPIEAAVGEAIANATSVRFDASDLMPGEVGAGTFWTGMTSYINGDADLDTILAEIEASWPEGIMGEDASEIEGGDTIVDIAVADGRFTTLVTAVTAAGLAETLSGPGPFTVLAPTDDAFAALPDGTVEALLEDPEGALTDILLYHVVDGAVLAETVVTLESATMLNGDDITIAVEDGSVILNGSVQVIITDIEGSNGVIHVIDAVLLPPEE